MLAIGPSFGCPLGDAVCYCSRPEFGYGVRDCAAQACQDQTNVPSVLNYGATYCAGK